MILDSGERREFDTGAVRDIQQGKGRCDLLPLSEIIEIIGDEVFRGIQLFQMTGNRVYLLNAAKCLIYKEFDKNSPDAILALARHFEAGAQKYGERNWEKGIPVHCYIDSAIRHYLKHLRGDTDEPHDVACLWNLICGAATCRMYPELQDVHPRMEDSNDY